MIYKTTIIIIIALFLSNTFTGIASPIKKASIKGIIVDSSSSQPIEYANLALINPITNSIVTGTISTDDGSFAIDNINRGVYQLKIHFIGYQTSILDSIKITSNKEQLDVGTIKLKPMSITLDETEIVANNNYINFKIDKKVINVSEQINAEGGAVVDALHNVPSVQVDASGNVSVRGSSSFTLLIDGRPSVISPSDALNQIMASSVDKIEVITNPSVKYDPDGTSGIINLIMKKQKSTGFNGQATITVATEDKYSANVAVSSRAKRISTNLALTYSNKRKQTDSKDDREIIVNDSNYFENIESYRDIYRRNYKLDGGISFYADDNNSLNFNVEIGQWEFDRSIDSKIILQNSFTPAKQFFNSKETYVVTNKYISGDFGYQHKFAREGHKIDASLYYSSLNNDIPNHITEYEVDEYNYPIPDSTSYFNIYNSSNRDHIRFKTDYVLPISKLTTFEAGYQNDCKISATDYTYKYKTTLVEDWKIDTTLSGELNFSRMVNSVYATLITSFKGISIQGGLRMEYVARLLQQEDQNKDYNYDDFNLFPSLHLSKTLKNKQQLSLSYSRRINRPNEWMLLPALNSTGRNMLQIGNPELLPDYTDSWELAFFMRTDKIMLSAELYARNTKNSITPTMTEINGSFYQSYENLNQELSAGTDLMSNINFTNWWRINISANIYYNKLEGTLKSGFVVNDASWSWNGRFRTTFIVKKKTYLEFMAIYYGPFILPQGKAQDFYYFDFFVKRNFFDRKLTIALRSHNTFDTGIYIEDTEGIDFKSHTWFKYEGPTFMATITYRLNNFKGKRSKNNVDMNFDSGLDH